MSQKLEVMKQIKALVKQGKFGFSEHANNRMIDRAISRQQAIATILYGRMVNMPADRPGAEGGGFQRNNLVVLVTLPIIAGIKYISEDGEVIAPTPTIVTVYDRQHMPLLGIS